MKKYIHQVSILSLSLLLLLTGCDTIAGTLNSSSQKAQSKNQTQTPTFIPPKPLTEAKDIVKDRGEGKYAKDRYNQKLVEKELDQIPKGLNNEQLFERLLALLGENYYGYEQVYRKLEKPTYKADVLELNPDSPQYKASHRSKSTKQGINAVILVDSSGSMNGKVNGETKMEFAKRAVKQFVEKLPPETQVLLRVYGHKGSNDKKDKNVSCQSTDVLYPFGQYETAKFDNALNLLKPVGWTPLSRAIEASYQDLESISKNGNKNIVYVVSDGIETCGGNPVQAARKLHDSNIEAIVNIIGFDLDAESKKALESVALAGGGTFQPVDSSNEFDQAFKKYADELNQQNDEWHVQAVEKITRNYQSDNQALENNHSEMLKATYQEFNRMDDALDYLYFKGKIDLQLWRDTGSHLDIRWLHLTQYADNEWRSVGGTIDQEWAKQTDEVDALYIKNGRKIDELQHKVSIRINYPNYKVNWRIPTVRIPKNRILSSPEK